MAKRKNNPELETGAKPASGGRNKAEEPLLTPNPSPQRIGHIDALQVPPWGASLFWPEAVLQCVTPMLMV